MPIIDDTIAAIETAVQASADSVGDDGTQIALGTPGGPPIPIPDVKNYERGQAWGTEKSFHSLIAGIVNGLWSSEILPVGTILMFNGSTIPDGWALCDGSGGTPDLRDRFVKGAPASTPGGTGGSTTTSAPSATIYPSSLPGGSFIPDPAHTHEHTPPYYEVVFIIKL